MLLSSGIVRKVLSVFFQKDREIARDAQGRGCRHCGGKLDVANFPRKARGWPPDSPAEWRVRFSFCCRSERCRRRMTPPSLRFLWRSVYLAIWVVSAGLWLAASRRAQTAAGRRRGHDRRTWSRWLDRWTRYSDSSEGRELHARLVSARVPSRLPLLPRLWAGLVWGRSRPRRPPWMRFVAHLCAPSSDLAFSSSSSMAV